MKTKTYIAWMAGLTWLMGLIGCSNPKKLLFSLKNPWGLEVMIYAADGTIRPDTPTDTLWVLVRNHYNQSVTLQPIGNEVFQLKSYPRFYKNKVYLLQAHALHTTPFILQQGDVKALGWITEQELMQAAPWKNSKGNSPARSPMMATAKQFQPYIRVMAEVKVQDRLIRSSEKFFSIDQKKPAAEEYKKVVLSISADENVIQIEKKNKENMLRCRIKNTSNYDQHFFENAGSVRFNLYGYSKNRTAVMVLRFKEEYFLRNRKITLKPGEEKEVFAENLYTLFYKEASANIPYYWEWNKKKEPVSPLYFSNGKPAYETEVWFGAVVDGKEYLSPSFTLRVVQKKSDK